MRQLLMTAKDGLRYITTVIASLAADALARSPHEAGMEGAKTGLGLAILMGIPFVLLIFSRWMKSLFENAKGNSDQKSQSALPSAADESNVPKTNLFEKILKGRLRSRWSVVAWAVVVFVVWGVVVKPLFLARIFGYESYDDCVLHRMDGQQPNLLLTAKNLCRKSNPTEVKVPPGASVQKNEKPGSHSSEYGYVNEGGVATWRKLH
jgi:hypothetical protein